MNVFDVIVIGGGVIGPAITYGLGRLGTKVALLDEGDVAMRAARANFGLVWVQGKGLGMPRYVQWTLESVGRWPAFAAELEERTGISTRLHQAGGLALCLGDVELAERHRHIEALREQAGTDGYNCDFLDRTQVQALIPELQLGDAVAGASFCPYDGFVNPLALMHALHVGLQSVGAQYSPAHKATNIRPDGTGFVVETPHGAFTAGKVVLAAGHGISQLAPQVGLDVPLRPERGQLIITERTAHLLSYPISGIEQTDDGTIMLGVSSDEVGFNDDTPFEATRSIAARAIAAFPALAGLRMVRTWAGLRVLTPDKHPVYEQSQTLPGAYVATSHSGITLAAVNADRVAPWIASGETPEDFDQFSTQRFHV